VVRPELVDEAIAGDDPPSLEREQREQRPLPPPRPVHICAVANLERAKQEEFHRRHPTLTGSS
jgi:hypothetical protein